MNNTRFSDILLLEIPCQASGGHSLNPQMLKRYFDVEYIYGFLWSEGLQTKSMTSQRYRATHKMADMRYYGNVMTTTRWRLYVTMETLCNNKMAAILHLQQYSRRLNYF